MSDRNVRPYVEHDRDACMTIFDSNAMPTDSHTPVYLDARERDDFARFLAHPIPRTGHAERYFVVEDDGGAIVACGGWGWTESRIALLCWGMVRRDRHREGIGTLLLEHRLAQIPRADFDAVEITTSQHAAAFFARKGFIELSVQRDFFAPGLHAHHMRLSLVRA